MGKERKSATMASLGEKVFLKRLLPQLYVDRRLKGGYGHDAAILDGGFDDFDLSFSMDRVPILAGRQLGFGGLESVWEDYGTWGRLAVTANCSDILASGGKPLAVMISVSCPRDWPPARVVDITLACRDECKRAGIVFGGGDTKESPVPQLVGAAIGLVKKGRELLRTGARPNQLLVVTGHVGGFLGAYFNLSQAGDRHEKRGEWLDYLRFPRAHWQEADLVHELECATAGMDASDGLHDVFLTLSQDRFGIELDLEKIPYHQFALYCAEKQGIPLANFAFGAGDWNIVFAMDENRFRETEELARSRGCTLTAVGRFTSGSKVRAYDAGGREFEITAPVNEHFKKRFEDQSSFMERIRNGAVLRSTGR